MNPVITIHRGEILQIHNMITKLKQARGNLHGLFSESKQPVVLIAFGGEESKRKCCKEKLAKTHGLRKLGEWFVENPTQREDHSGEVSLVFNDSGHLVRHSIHDISANCDIIDGQSAFRLDPSVTDMLKTQTGLESSEMVMTTQWYSTEEGSTILGEILKQLPVTPQMSRNKTTQDFTILVHVNEEPIEINFPNNFPITEPEVIYRHNKEHLQMTPLKGTNYKAVKIAELLCSAVFDFIRSTANQSELGKVNEMKENNLNESGNDMKQGRSQDTQRDHAEKSENYNGDLIEEVEDEDKKEDKVSGRGYESNQPQKKPLNDTKNQSQDKHEDGEVKNPTEAIKENSGVKEEKEVSSEVPNAKDCKDYEKNSYETQSSHSETNTSHTLPPRNKPENDSDDIKGKVKDEDKKEHQVAERTCKSNQPQKKPLNDTKDQSQDKHEDGSLAGESKIPTETNKRNSDVGKEKEVSSDFQNAMECKDYENHSEMNTSHAPPPGNETENKCEEGTQIADTNESRMEVDENQRTSESENEPMDTSL